MLTVLHNPPHANFCRLLERDLERCFQFVEPSDAHSAVYSDEFARIIILACVEIENALRGFVACAGGPTGQKNLGDFHGVVTGKFPKFCSMEMLVARTERVIKPWEHWQQDQAPDWWKLGYNKLKHDRLGNPTAATLERAIFSVAALQALSLHVHRLLEPKGFIPSRLVPEVIVPYEKNAPVPGVSEAVTFELPDDAV